MDRDLEESLLQINRGHLSEPVISTSGLVKTEIAQTSGLLWLFLLNPLTIKEDIQSNSSVPLLSIVSISSSWALCCLESFL